MQLDYVNKVKKTKWYVKAWIQLINLLRALKINKMFTQRKLKI